MSEFSCRRQAVDKYSNTFLDIDDIENCLGTSCARIYEYVRQVGFDDILIHQIFI